MMARLNTSLEATGAEFLVLGNLLINGIRAYKAYVNWPGYDIVAVNPEKNLSCRIQVKSRWASDFDKAFIIKNFDCDFVVLVALNRGSTKKQTIKATAPNIYVFPVEIVKAAQLASSTWGKSSLRKILPPYTFKSPPKGRA